MGLFLCWDGRGSSPLRGCYCSAFLVEHQAGAIAGLMFAPKTGKETRQIVSIRAGEARHKTGHYVGNLRQRMRRVENTA